MLVYWYAFRDIKQVPGTGAPMLSPSQNRFDLLSMPNNNRTTIPAGATREL